MGPYKYRTSRNVAIAGDCRAALVNPENMSGYTGALDRKGLCDEVLQNHGEMRMSDPVGAVEYASERASKQAKRSIYVKCPIAQ